MDNLNESILFTPKAIALLVNENALDDIRIFLFTLQLWNKALPKLYVYCTSQNALLICYHAKIFLQSSTIFLKTFYTVSSTKRISHD